MRIASRLPFHMLEVAAHFHDAIKNENREWLPPAQTFNDLRSLALRQLGEAAARDMNESPRVLTEDLGTFPRMVMYLLAFSLATRIICLGAIFGSGYVDSTCGRDNSENYVRDEPPKQLGISGQVSRSCSAAARG